MGSSSAMPTRGSAVPWWAESARSALGSIRAHGFRSFLTTLGIVIGVASVIAVVSIFQGLSRSISDQFAGLGSNSLTIRADTTFEDQMQGKRSRIGYRDYRYLVDHLDDVRDIAPSFDVLGDYGGNVHSGKASAFTRVMASTPSYQDSHQSYPRVGRFITASDNDSRRRVCVVGEKLRQNLKLPVNPIGHYIVVGGEWFKVVGAMEARGEIFGFSQDDFLLIPFNTGLALAVDGVEPDLRISLQVEDIDRVDEIRARIVALLRASRALGQGDADDFKVETAEQLSGSFSEIIGMVAMVFAGIVSVSLLVGGIGIMNIMLVSVTERTREIGICKALGASRRSVMAQFLLEAVILSVLGGVIGVISGFFLAYLVSALIPGFPAASAPWWAICLAVGFSTAVGLLFGILPASKAASLDPIDALRYE